MAYARTPRDYINIELLETMGEANNIGALSLHPDPAGGRIPYLIVESQVSIRAMDAPPNTRRPNKRL